MPFYFLSSWDLEFRHLDNGSQGSWTYINSDCLAGVRLNCILFQLNTIVVAIPLSNPHFSFPTLAVASFVITSFSNCKIPYLIYVFIFIFNPSVIFDTHRETILVDTTCDLLFSGHDHQSYIGLGASTRRWPAYGSSRPRQNHQFWIVVKFPGEYLLDSLLRKSSCYTFLPSTSACRSDLNYSIYPKTPE